MLLPWNEVIFRSNNSLILHQRNCQVEADIPSTNMTATSGQPWFDQSCKRAIYRKNAVYRAWQKPEPTKLF